MIFLKNNRKGFTLGELLIVVAIVGVLTSISIPIFKNKLIGAKIAVDQANVRNARAAAIAEYLEDFEDEEYVYDAEKGVVLNKDDNLEVNGYGKTPSENITGDIRKIIGATGNPMDEDGNSNYVIVSFKDGNIECSWNSGNIDDEKDEGSNEEESNDYKDLTDKVEPEKWEDGRNSFQPGLLIGDDTGIYVFFRNNDWYGGSNNSLSDMVVNYPNCVKKIDKSIEIRKTSEYHRGDYIAKGTILKNGDGNYLIRCESGKICDDPIIKGSDNWVLIKGKQVERYKMKVQDYKE